MLELAPLSPPLDLDSVIQAALKRRSHTHTHTQQADSEIARRAEALRTAMVRLWQNT